MQLTPAQLIQILHQVVGPTAIDKLVADLEILAIASIYPDPEPTKQKNVYSVLKSGAFTANKRAAGGTVVDQTPVDSLTDITALETEVSFTIDAQAFAQMTVLELGTRINDAVKTVAEQINIDAMDTLANQAGVQQVGTLGVAIGQTEMQAARLAFGNNKIPQGPRIGILSYESEFALKADPAYDGAFSFSNAITQAGLPSIEGYQLFTSSYVESPAASQHTNLLIHPPSVQQIFPPQEMLNDAGRIKVPISYRGINMAILKENDPQTNGGTRWTVSVLHGIKATREEGMIQLLGT